MDQHLLNIQLLIQQSALADEEKQALLKQTTDADKQWSITEFKFDSAEKTIEAQNRELKIEAALERVRAVAMSMKDPADMLEICRTISQQLEALHVQEIRNVQTAILYEDKGTYMNYEYYAKHDKTLITETSFTNHKMHREFAAQMIKGTGEFFTTYISKIELPNWIAYQKTTNVFIDTYLETASSLSYYWHSLGPVALGISTYEPLKEEETNLFRRFLKVFELSYTRYSDIEQAIAQAKEAQIEAALERVRSKTMAMYKNEDLLGVLNLLVEQLIKLGVQLEVANFSNGIPNGDWDLWIEVVADDGTIFNNNVHFPRIDHPYFHHVEKNIETFRNDGTDFFKDVFSKEEKASWMDYIHTQTIYKDLTSEEIKQSIYDKPGYTWSMVILKNTWVSICRFNTIPFSDEEDALLRRFANAFGQAYTRFLDLQKAEAQARESQIEAALERVRSRTIAMQRSEDLFEVIREVNAQLQLLNFRFDSADFLTDYTDKGYKLWVASVQESFTKPFYITASNTKIPMLLKEAMKRGDDFFTFTLNREEKNKYFDHVFQSPVAKEASDESKQFIYNAEGMAISSVVVKNIILSIANFACIPYKDAENEIIRRFAFVFEQSYTRFLDLQKAEAQAREAQIEAALERVRSRSLAMHKSDELQEVVHTVFEKLKELNVDLYTAIIFIFQEGSKDVVWWLANKANQQYARILVPYADIHYLKNLFDAKESGKDFFAATYSFEEKNELFHHLFEHTDFKYVPEPQKEFLLESELATMSVVLAKNTGINITSYSRKSFSESDNEILKRFAKVFDQAYTRFLDLQKAEAQAREAKIEAALERVRSRSIAMRKSEEIADIAGKIFSELRQLDLTLNRVLIWTFNDIEKYTTWWSSNPEVESTAESYRIDYNENPVFINYLQAWKQRKPIHLYFLAGDTKKSWSDFLFEHTELSRLPAAVRKNMREEGDLFTISVISDYGLMMTGSLEPLSDANIDIIHRFGRVFHHSYPR